jgi:hypothetical protein
MIRLNASYAKKTKAEEEFSSKSFHASIEIELPDGLNEVQLQDRIHSTFQLVRDSVEAEINGKANSNSKTVPVQVQVEKTVEPKANGNGNGNGQKKASEKQVKFLLDLARTMKVNLGDYLSLYGVKNAFDLDKESASKLIEELKLSGKII